MKLKSRGKNTAYVQWRNAARSDAPTSCLSADRAAADFSDGQHGRSRRAVGGEARPAGRRIFVSRAARRRRGAGWRETAFPHPARIAVRKLQRRSARGKAAVGINCTVIRRAEPALCAGFGIPRRAEGGICRIAAAHEDLPVRPHRREIPRRLDDFDDMAETIVRLWINRIDLFLHVSCIVGQYRSYATGFWFGLNVFRSIHQHRTENVRDKMDFVQHVRMGAEIVLRRQRPVAEGERQPCDGSIRIEASGIKRALAQKIEIGLARIPVIDAGADELIA